MPKKRSYDIREPQGVPQFASEADERAFWLTHDSTSYVDWSSSKHIRLSKLQPSTPAVPRQTPPAE